MQGIPVEISPFAVPKMENFFLTGMGSLIEVWRPGNNSIPHPVKTMSHICCNFGSNPYIYMFQLKKSDFWHLKGDLLSPTLNLKIKYHI
jgi:hypothetical protein